MGVDKSYGSGKSRTAANSTARRRVATGKLTKSIPKKRDIAAANKRLAASPLGQGAGLAMSFLPLGRATRVAQTLLNANKGSKAAALLARSATAEAGRAASRQWAATRAMAGSGKKFQASAAKSWHMRFLGENLKAAANAVPKKASLAVPPTIGKKLANANSANTAVRRAESAFNESLRAAKGKSFGVLENLETAASKLQRLRSNGVPKRGR